MTISIRCLVVFFFVYSCAYAVNNGNGGRGLTKWYDLLVDGIPRSYMVYSPDEGKCKNMPMMMVLHGGLGNAKSISKVSGMNAVADAERFLVVYPDGTSIGPMRKNRRVWNAGSCCGRAAKNNIDDVKFLAAVIEDVQKNYYIDNRRVYIAGMSNGAMMAYRAMCEIPDKIAAVVAVAGTLAVDNCDAGKDIPVLHIHGTGDKNVPIAGGSGDQSVSRAKHRSLADTIEAITSARHCTAPERRMLSDKIQQSTYRCSNGAPVQVVLLEGGTHSWPGGPGRAAKKNPHHDFQTSRHAWEFVKSCRK